MAITVTALSPASNAVDVPLTTEIVIRYQSTVAFGGNQFDIFLNDGVTGFFVMTSLGVFVNGWTGEVIDNAPGLDTDYTIILHRPGNDYKFFEGVRVQCISTVENNAPESVLITTSFFTEFFAFKQASSGVYTENLPLNVQPAGWTAQISGTATAPVFSASGMDTFPNAAGACFIRKTLYGLNFATGVMFDFTIVQKPGGTNGLVRVLRLFKGGFGSISVFVDLVNLEAWIGDVDNIPPTSHRVSLKDATTNTFMRLTVKGTANTLVARLFAGRFGVDQTPLLQMTAGPSTVLGTTEDQIELGSIDSGNKDIRVVSAGVINNANPDAYYPFPVISSILPQQGSIIGGDNLRLVLSRKIDVALGSSIFRTANDIRDESSGAGSSAVATGFVSLTLAGIGVAAIRYLHSLSGDRPSAADVSIDFEVNQVIVQSPPQTEAVLAAVEMRANGSTFAIEMASSIASGTFFRAVATASGVSTLNNKLADTTQSKHNIRFVRVGLQIIIFINGQRMMSTALAEGIGILRLYSQSTVAFNHITKFSNFKVRPVLRIGQDIVA